MFSNEVMGQREACPHTALSSPFCWPDVAGLHARCRPCGAGTGHFPRVVRQKPDLLHPCRYITQLRRDQVPLVGDGLETLVIPPCCPSPSLTVLPFLR